MKLRKEKGLSQKEIAKIARVNQTAVSQWETGKTAPNANAAFYLCEYFDVSFEYLIGRSDIRDFFYYDMTQVEEEELARKVDSVMNQEHFEAYQILDEHGKDVVNAVTRVELKRVIAEMRDDERSKYEIDPVTLIELKRKIDERRGTDAKA